MKTKKSVLIFLACLVFLPFLASAQFMEGLNNTAGTGQDFSMVNDRPIIAYFGGILGVFYGLLGVVFLIYLFYGGLVWFTGGSSSEGFDKAKKIITNALVGLFLTLFAAGISQFFFQLASKTPDGGLSQAVKNMFGL